MKIRNGFVSNSSSSSFVIAIKDGIPRPEQLYKYLYGERSGFGWNDMVNHIYMDLSQADPKTPEEIFGIFEYSYLCNVKSSDFRQEDGSTDWDAYSKAIRIETRKKLQEFLDSFPEHQFYVLEYSDNDGACQAQLEHDVPWYCWQNVLVISNH